LERELSAVKKEKEAVEKKLTTRLTKALTELSKAISELQEEKALNRSLVANQSTWQQRVSQLEQQLEQVRGDRDRTVTQLEEQLRDIYLHLEARDKMKDSELEGGQVVVAPSPTSPPSTRPGTGSKGARSKRKGK
jgi:predicted  nucleic acid-binding Zn-ribbon protein